MRSESDVFNQWEVGTQFYLKDSDLSKSDLHNTCLWMCILAQTMEISEDPRRRVVNAHRGWKRLHNHFHWLRQSTVRTYCVQTYKTIVILPRSGRPANITQRARCVIGREVTKEAMETSKRLMARLLLANVLVSTIRRQLSNNGVLHDRAARRKPLLYKQDIAVNL